MLVDGTKLGWLLGRRTRGVNTDEPSGGPVLGHDDQGGVVTWPSPRPERAGHLLCMAASGAGKTAMVASALVQEFVASKRDSGSPHALFVADPKGDLIAMVLAGLAHRAPERLRDVVVLDPFSAAAFPFNLIKLPLEGTPIDIRCAQLAALVAEVSTSAGAQAHLGVGARQLDVLQHVLLGAATAEHPRATLLWALDAIVARDGFRLLASLTRSARAKQFLESANLNDELRASTSSRLRTALASTESLERLVAAPSCVSFAELLAPGRALLVDLGRPPGGMPALQRFWASLLIALAVDHLMARPSPFPGHHCRLVADEAQVVAAVLAERAEAVLTMGRSKNLSLTVITQGTTLIRDASQTLWQVLANNAPVKLVGRLPAPDASLLGAEQAPKKGVDESLSATRARFVAAVTNLEDRAFFYLAPGRRERFRSAEIDLDAWRRASEEHAGEIAEARNRLTLPEASGPRVSLSEAAPAPARARTRAVAPPPANEPQNRRAAARTPAATPPPRRRQGEPVEERREAPEPRAAPAPTRQTPLPATAPPRTRPAARREPVTARAEAPPPPAAPTPEVPPPPPEPPRVPEPGPERAPPRSRWG